MKTIIGTVAAIAIVAGGVFVFKGEGKEPAIAPSAIVYRTDGGFSPAEVTIKRGESVAFVNSTNGEIWPASNSHPLHDVYPEFDPKRPIKPGETWTFTFDRAGDWGFHDHLRSNRAGVVRVTQ